MEDYTLTIEKFEFDVYAFIEAFKHILDDEDKQILIENSK